MIVPTTVERVERRLSPWVALVETTVTWPDRPQPELYHAIGQADYVSVLAITADGRIPLVRQYRPGCGEVTLELPGGMLEADEDPADCARREVFEETGCDGGELSSLGILWPDPGRLANRLHCFVITGMSSGACGWQAERGLERSFVRAAELRSLVVEGRLGNAHHVALVGLALAAGVGDL